MDLHRIRQETPGCLDHYFMNSAGASLMPQSVLDSMIDYLREEQLYGGYEVAARKEKLLAGFYIESGKLLHTNPSQIAFMTSATDAYAKALSSIPFREGDCIVTSTNDYISNQLAFLSLQQRMKVKVLRMDNLPEGGFDPDSLQRLIRTHHPRLVAITHIPTNSGLIQDVETAGNYCRENDILYLVDACQSVGQLELDVEKIGCDFLTATGRKFLRGPRGTGLLYVSQKVLDTGLAPLFLDMRGAEWQTSTSFRLVDTARRFEHWEINYSALTGLAAAIRYANEVGMVNIENYHRQLCKSLRHLLQNNAAISLLDQGTNLGSIVTFTQKDGTIEGLRRALDRHGVRYSISLRSNAVIDFSEKGVEAAIRLSPHYFNSASEIETVAAFLNQEN